MTNRKALAWALLLCLAIPSSAQAEDTRDLRAMSLRISKEVDACIGKPLRGYGHFTVVFKFYGDGTLRGDPEVLSGGSTGKLNLLGRSVAAKLRACAPFASIVSLGAAPREMFEMPIVY